MKKSAKWSLLLAMVITLPVWATEVTVYKSPTCGCCKKWVKHLKSNGFKVTTYDQYNVLPIKAKNGITPQLMSCHTALVNGYVVEGHVPAADIKRMLKEKPNIQGLAVPGMIVGSPGMEQGSRKDPYAVLSFDKNGRTSVYARH
ncbi:MAG: DUF411 domain-containing protein [Gammaproteobacteria bacterium]|nr:MAG: DUF411 domain-containing protein [Gammaproteobacteria bacterium]